MQNIYKLEAVHIPPRFEIHTACRSDSIRKLAASYVIVMGRVLVEAVLHSVAWKMDLLNYAPGDARGSVAHYTRPLWNGENILNLAILCNILSLSQTPFHCWKTLLDASQYLTRSNVPWNWECSYVGVSLCVTVSLTEKPELSSLPPPAQMHISFF